MADHSGSITTRALAPIPSCPTEGCHRSVSYLLGKDGLIHYGDACSEHAPDLEAALVESLRLTKTLHESGELPKIPRDLVDDAAPAEGRIKPPTTKAAGPNPKDLRGRTKASLTKIPAVALAHCASAMMDGARKYDPYNWRAKDVQAHIYVDAALRHLLAWFEGEDFADDSRAHHLGHAMACCAILIDAQETGGLIDDRPATDRSRGALERVLASVATAERIRQNAALGDPT